jgi:CheY-like chemotaxis protein
VLADGGQLEQVLMNLAVNARDAMPAGGRLDIRTSNVELDGGIDPDVKPGPYVEIAVADNGIGMSEETRLRVFEPFFTTKERDKGTGLGLSTVYGIVAQSGGHVAVESAMGEGTTFRIHLPRADRPAVGVVAKPVPRARGGDEWILLVEDEEAVRALASTILRRGGYHVIEATKPVDAEQIFSGLDRGIDLLVTDMSMPGGTGAGLHATLLAKQPGLRVVFMSGYPGGMSIDGNPTAGFLEKPFPADRLMRAVRQALDR